MPSHPRELDWDRRNRRPTQSLLLHSLKLALSGKREALIFFFKRGEGETEDKNTSLKFRYVVTHAASVISLAFNAGTDEVLR